MNNDKGTYSFPWDGCEEMNHAYELDNYKIKYTNSKKKNAIVFFTGHGLYFPNNKEEMQKKIFLEDKYEWDNIAKNKMIQKHFSKIIFVRDVFKQWYITGINKTYDTQDKVISFIASETIGYRVTTCGNSAGGYMAVLVGLVINAEKIITDSGQFSILDNNVKDNHYVSIYEKDETRNKYFDLTSLMDNNSKNIFYFYPQFVKDDLLQRAIIDSKGEGQTNIVAFDSYVHGTTVEGKCYPYIICMNRNKLSYHCNKFTNTTVNRQKFTKEVLPKYILVSNFFHENKLIKSIYYRFLKNKNKK